MSKRAATAVFCKNAQNANVIADELADLCSFRPTISAFGSQIRNRCGPCPHTDRRFHLWRWRLRESHDGTV